MISWQFSERRKVGDGLPGEETEGGSCMVVSQERRLKVGPVWWSPRRGD